MDEFEMQEVEGGGFWKWCFVALAFVCPVALVTVGVASGAACFVGAVGSGLAEGSN